MFGSRKKALEKLSSQWGVTKQTTFNFYQIARYHARKVYASSAHVLSERTISALDFPELFAYLDRTVSRVGQQWLFSRLAAYERHENLQEFEAIVKHAADHEQERLDAQLALSRLQHENAYGICSLLYDRHPAPPWFLPLIKVQCVLSVLFLMVTLVFHQFFIAWVLLMGVNVLVHYYYKSDIQQYTFAMDQLALMTRTVSELSQLSFPYRNKQEVSGALKSVKEVIGTWTILGNSAGGGLDVSDLAWLLREYVKMIFLIEPLLFFHVIKKLTDKRDDVRSLFEYVGMVDTCISVLSVRQTSHACIPVRASASKGMIRAADMFHPLISKCQANTWDVTDRSLLITGSNMSGKSAFIRTVAVNVLCAHTINTCFAKAFEATFLKVHAVMNISDDLIEGKSYYMEEVLSIRKLVECSQTEGQCLFLMDEIFRGTNTTERIAAAFGVLTFLNKNNMAIAATHDSELTTLLSESFDLYHFCETAEQDGMSFDYVLRKGKLKHGNAIRILALNGYPSEIIQQAQHLAARENN